MHFRVAAVPNSKNLPLAKALEQAFVGVEHENPKALQESLERYGRDNHLNLLVSQHNGVVFVDCDGARLLQIRSIS